jgi:YfiH family protein
MGSRNAALFGAAVETWLRPRWPEPQRLPAGLRALMSTRAGGVSVGVFSSLNLRWPDATLPDDVQAVRENRRRFEAALALRPRWLRQVHGHEVLALDPSPAGEQPAPVADAAFSQTPGIACAVQVADCLPVLLVADAHDPQGQSLPRVCAAAHAGWRGLASGVLQAAVARMCSAAGVQPAHLQAWLGPCIGPSRFEVGAEVLQAFADGAEHFVRRDRPDGSPRWLCDLPALARRRLAEAGVRRVGGGSWCTVERASEFFSHRASGGLTGRMAAAIGFAHLD